MKLTIEMHDEKVTIESDVETMDELFDIYERLSLAIGYQPNTVKNYFSI